MTKKQVIELYATKLAKNRKETRENKYLYVIEYLPNKMFNEIIKLANKIELANKKS